MKRLPIWIALVLAVAACNKPSEGDCRKALANMQHLMGTENLRDAAALEGEVRRCKGGSKRKAVQCAMAAQTLEELQKCEFYHVPVNAKGVGTVDAVGSAGSAVGSAGSAGSAAEVGSAGSAATTPDTGSAGSAGAAGSAAGSAAPAGAGSGSTGSAAGSAAAAPVPKAPAAKAPKAAAAPAVTPAAAPPAKGSDAVRADDPVK